jgi:hypothetical protein
MYDKKSTIRYIEDFLPEGDPVSDSVKTLISRIEKERLYKGKGGEIMRAGVCHLIFSISTAKLKLNNQLLH